MQCTTSSERVAVGDCGGMVFDVGSLWNRLEQLTDTRRKRGRRYRLSVVLVLLVLAKLAGQDRPSGIADWVSARKEQLLVALQLPLQRLPHHNTYRRIIEQVVDPEELERTVSDFFRGLPRSGRSVVVAIDGKTVRGTIDVDHPHGEHLLAAYLPEEGIVLMQVAAGEKENEITVAPKLLACLDLRGKVVIGDAMHTQRHLSVQILEAGGEYLWVVKDNQPTLRADIAQVFAPETPTVLGNTLPNDWETFQTVEKGHGRRETRTITVSSLLHGYSDWPGLAQVFKLERQRVEVRRGKATTEVVYGLTSLRRDEASPQRLLALSRTYWGIENGLHYCRDVTFQEDRGRLTRGNAGRVMATLNNLVIGLLRYTGATNLAQARRTYDAHFTKALTLLISSPRRL
jgi:predicted transposase YbfD/YdcC